MVTPLYLDGKCFRSPRGGSCLHSLLEHSLQGHSNMSFFVLSSADIKVPGHAKFTNIANSLHYTMVKDLKEASPFSSKQKACDYLGFLNSSAKGTSPQLMVVEYVDLPRL